MKNEVLAHIDLTKFEGHSQIKMEGTARDLIILTATFIRELSEEMGEDPRDVSQVLHRYITRVQAQKPLKGGRKC